MKVVIPGGSGQVGTVLARHFHASGNEVVVLSRAPRPAPWKVLVWDARSPGVWGAELDGADAVINLVGRSVNCRYTVANRRDIVESRVRSVQLLADAVARCARPPRVWLQASTATIYAHRYDAPNDERTCLLGAEPDAPDTWKFSFDVATRWEQALETADVPRTRKVAMRAAITLSPDRGGVFDVLLGLVRRRLGGRAGDGRQFVSWVHDHDFVAAVEFLIRREDITGAVNIAAPHPLPNADFMRGLREAWGAGFGLPAMRWMIEVGAWLMRTESELVLKSRRVVPGRLLEAGFAFRFPNWPEAARDLCARWRSERGA
ncbi:TIGR01777 family oxidoreductase [Gemmata sp. JC717]|uniref:TIGR01777 family oxidoreductase n=1 Tax=Gemmata algarum TaxID=2975278 RepID=UPI0021BAB63F|nr:TIGR01777 family oxidoreductase [Gemmata algarum]MDY3551963.1 TIGR01777 family oxidoreductase [Gemmata algarum]